MTDSEKNIIRELLEEVFQAKQSQSPEALAKAQSMYEATEPSKVKGKRRRLQQDNSDIQLVLDELKQTIEDCPTKVELLQWTQSNVFSILDSSETSSSPSSSALTKGDLTTTQQLRLVQHLIPNLMRNFRQRFSDPHLALFIFKAVRNQSTQSYVYGCSTATYNELIALLWDSFRDLQGIRDALEEMLLNSVDANGQTQNKAERACREAMDDKLWLDRTEEGDEVAMTTLSSISDLLVDLMAAKENKAGEYGRRRRDMLRGVRRSDRQEDDSEPGW
ncbi:hypothetical protein EST38_g4521 [Candolleomyces aberdarensis]|uniref:Mtf2-like C-terminal domain-containing protein n=1 Tax=Candolleomyces aberdarensis TaxID=2316362 RepID=A0A4Q2DMD8_9AGAR|nr:hypothetical protein EST38_g4521 [Candolleomyces aberdarensis]